jgi:adenylate kinase
MNAVILGPPGAGKGTQAQVLAQRLSVTAISTGDIFRANVEGQTELGRRASAYLDAGDLVPDSITVDMVSERLSEPDVASGFLLDGFPRTVAQAEQLEGILAERGRRVHHVIELSVVEEELIRRLSERRVLVRGEWVQRADDRAETVRHRLEVYRRQTAPVSRFYAHRELLALVDACGEVEAVTSRILDGLAGRRLDQQGPSVTEPCPTLT